ncbi:MAG: lipid-A-disaccharide synthase [Cyanobacteriota bacterium]|nr:lipid-A-disaccharide synthase [Cyanobacteriota bacterium]
MTDAVDILILSNGPGEVTTWVRPVVRELRRQLGDDRDRLRISVVLSPCPNASGREADIARSYREVDRVQEPQGFWRFLLRGETTQNWDWRKTGAIVFLGGDQIFPVILGLRLGYRTVVYAEWDARWHRWIDRFGVMKPQVMAGVAAKYADKFTVVGDLMADVSRSDGDRNLETLEGSSPDTTQELIGILPGSKSFKLTQGLPLSLAIAERIHYVRPQTRFVIPVAPTLDIETLAQFANPQYNSAIRPLGWTAADLKFEPDCFSCGQQTTSAYLETRSGLKVYLWTHRPAYNLLSRCRLCLTTVGANTAELGSLAVPMLVLMPTQQLDAMRAWDGLPGLLVNLPLVGTAMAKFVNWCAWRWLSRKAGASRLAWPNIWAQEQIVPELIGRLKPGTVARLALNYLENPQRLAAMSDRLRSVRGKPGAARKLAQLVVEVLR